MSTYLKIASVVIGVAVAVIVATASPTPAVPVASPTFQSGWQQAVPLLDKDESVQHKVILAQKSNSVKKTDSDLAAIEKELADNRPNMNPQQYPNLPPGRRAPGQIPGTQNGDRW